MLACLHELEIFLNTGFTDIPPLVQAALAHAQFETIHPFLDGNGRLGRLLIALFLCERGLLAEPLLYLSLHFKTHRRTYYALLDAIRTSGDWEGWLSFFADAVASTAREAADTVERLAELERRSMELVRGLGRAAPSAEKVLRAMMEMPVISPKRAAAMTGLSQTTTNRALDSLESLGVVREMTSARRNRLYRYDEYVDIMEAGAGSPPGGARR